MNRHPYYNRQPIEFIIYRRFGIQSIDSKTRYLVQSNRLAHHFYKDDLQQIYAIPMSI